jgi:uncharacterized alpha-E superfamily protein
MLARTAENLFWLARYVERAECLARILDAGYRLAALPQAYGSPTNEWESAVATAGCLEQFEALYPVANEENVTEYLAFSPDNPSSILNCFELARANGRAVRTALTIEMWDAINAAWHEIKKFDPAHMDREATVRFLEFVKEASIRFDGCSHRTMLRRDAYYFAQLGVLLERADATARILDVKYHVLLPEYEPVGGPLDYFQWTSLLRSVSALTSYHWVYRDAVKPWLVADLLILNRQMPRSLACCYDEISHCLDELATEYGRQGPAQRLARTSRAKLLNANMQQIFQSGLHEFISDFLTDNHRLGNVVAAQYMV